MSNNSRHPRILIDILRRREGENAQAAILADTADVIAGVPQGTSSTGVAAPAQAIEARSADPTGSDLYEGRVWEIGGAFKFFTGALTRLLNVLTTKGDLHTFGATDARLPVGADGTYLGADSTQATGIGWGAIVGLPVFLAKGDLWSRRGTVQTDRAYGKIGAASSVYQPIANAFDANDATYFWCNNGGANEWLSVDLAAIYTIAQFRFTQTAAGSNGYKPNVVIQSSPDNSTWTDRYTYASAAPTDSGRVSLSAPVAARYWRLLAPAAGTYVLQVGSFELWDDPGAANDRVPVGADGKILMADSSLNFGVKWASGDLDLVVVLDGGGSVLPTGVRLDVPFDFACVILGWTILLDQSGAVQIDLWSNTYANFPPLVAATMPGANANKPQVASAVKATGGVAGWTKTAFAAGDTLRVNVDSAGGATRATLGLKLRRT